LVRFHVGKVLKVLGISKDIVSAESETHAIVEMWDTNQFLLKADARIAAQVKEGNIVVVDYNPIPGFPQPIPKQTIVKILRGKQGKECWLLFEKYRETRKKKAENIQEPELPSIPYSR